MNCVLRKCVYALLGIFIPIVSSFAKENVDANATSPKNQFQWQEHSKLTWDDFKGAVNTTHNESAAATFCSIGFKTGPALAGTDPEIIVYNTFYVNKSWVRSDARIQSILDHEQGHFDLCEIYTRKLKQRIGSLDLKLPDAKQALMRIYSEVSNEYEMRQQAYEQETTHGTNISEQKKWQDAIAAELNIKELPPSIALL